MSYDIDLTCPETGAVLNLEAPHFMRGGTFAVGGTTEASINVTYNYAPHFRRVLGESGIRSIYGKTAAETIQVLSDAIEQLDADSTDDYWEPTEGNAALALAQLLALAVLRPDGVWAGD
jgi:hypothetical protein